MIKIFNLILGQWPVTRAARGSRRMFRRGRNTGAAAGVEALLTGQRDCRKEKCNLGEIPGHPKQKTEQGNPTGYTGVSGIRTDISLNTSWVRISQGNRVRLAFHIRKKYIYKKIIISPFVTKGG